VAFATNRNLGTENTYLWSCPRSFPHTHSLCILLNLIPFPPYPTPDHQLMKPLRQAGQLGTYKTQGLVRCLIQQGSGPPLLIEHLYLLCKVGATMAVILSTLQQSAKRSTHDCRSQWGPMRIFTYLLPSIVVAKILFHLL
jgi:hypothetical protein